MVGQGAWRVCTWKILQAQMASTSEATKIIQLPSTESCFMRSYSLSKSASVIRTIGCGGGGGEVVNAKEEVL